MARWDLPSGQWLARELKSVFVDCEAKFIQIKLHKCHINELNVHSQVVSSSSSSGSSRGEDVTSGVDSCKYFGYLHRPATLA